MLARAERRALPTDHLGSKSVFEKWVARATGPPRSATRRPEQERLPRLAGRHHQLAMPFPLKRGAGVVISSKLKMPVGPEGTLPSRDQAGRFVDESIRYVTEGMP